MSSKRDFLVGITTLTRRAGSVLRFDLTGVIEDLRVVSSFVDSAQPVEVKGSAEAVHGGIMVTAFIMVPWFGECRRCLGIASGKLDISARELYEREDSAREVSEHNDDSYPYTGEVIDLRKMVKDQVLLALPLAPLCDKECKGLCLTCGSDLNSDFCGCEPESKDPRWNALDALVSEKR